MKGSASHGFTLLEVMMVVAIIGVLVGMASWGMSSMMPALRTNDLARQIVMDMRSAQSIAARTNNPVVATFTVNDPTCQPTADGNAWGYAIVGTSANGVPSSYAHRCFSEYPGIVAIDPGFAPAGALQAVGEAGAGVGAPISASTLFGGGQFRFFPIGDTDSAAGLSLAVGPQIDVNSGRLDRLRAIGIGGLTGRARVYMWDVVNNAWGSK